jgi:hypothetical protein
MLNNKLTGGNSDKTKTEHHVVKECVDWLNRQVEKRKYSSRSHAIEIPILEGMKATLEE